MFVGITRYDHESLKQKSESSTSVEQESSSDEVEARTLIDWNLTEDLFDTTDSHKVLAAGDATDAGTCT